jgi:hypothetical protein
MAAATNTVLTTPEDYRRSIRFAERALAILDGLPDTRNSPSAYSDAGIFYRHLGDKVASKDAAGIAAAGSDASYWYRKSLSVLLRSERIELAWDRQYRQDNSSRDRPGLTSLPAKLYLDLGRTYSRLSDQPHVLSAFERGRALESSPDLLQDLGL